MARTTREMVRAARREKMVEPTGELLLAMSSMVIVRASPCERCWVAVTEERKRERMVGSTLLKERRLQNVISSSARPGWISRGTGLALIRAPLYIIQVPVQCQLERGSSVPTVNNPVKKVFKIQH